MRQRNLVFAGWLLAIVLLVLPAYVHVAAHRGGRVLGVEVFVPMLVLIFGTFLALQWWANARGGRHHAKGMLAYEKGEFFEAGPHFARAFQWLPGANWESEFMLGMVHLQLWQPQLAIRWLSQVPAREAAAPLELARALLGEPLRSPAPDRWPLTDLIIACRAGHFDAAAAIASRPGARPAGKLGSLWDALERWAGARTGQHAGPVDLVALLGEVAPERIRAFWPDLIDQLLAQPRV